MFGLKKTPGSPSPAQQRLLDAVRVGLGFEPLAELPPLDLSVIRLANLYRVLEQVAVAADRAGVEPKAGFFLRQILHREREHALRVVAGVERVFGTLASAGIPHLFFKGPALAVLSGRAATERSGQDVDFLIHPEDWPEAHRALTDGGLELQTAPPPGSDTRTRFVLWSSHEALYGSAQAGDDPIGGFDLHWRLWRGHIPSLDSSRLIPDSVPVDLQGVAVPTLEPNAALAYACLHGAFDRWRDLRSVVDAHFLLSHTDATWEGARAFLPHRRALDECRAGLEALGGSRSDSTQEPPGAHRVWARGFLEGPVPKRRLAHALGDRWNATRLVPSLRSTMAILAHSVAPSDSMLGLSLRAWPLAVLRIPGRAGRKLGT